MTENSDCLDRIRKFLTLRYGRAEINNKLGEGTDGAVWAVEGVLAAKAFHPNRFHQYINERDAYLRFAEFGVGNKLGRFSLPVMRGYDDRLMVVLMDLILAKPYILDFAKVKIDRPPEFSQEVLRDMRRQGREDFGPNWPAVEALLADLESLQIYYLDPKNHNIVF